MERPINAGDINLYPPGVEPPVGAGGRVGAPGPPGAPVEPEVAPQGAIAGEQVPTPQAEEIVDPGGDTGGIGSLTDTDIDDGLTDFMVAASGGSQSGLSALLRKLIKENERMKIGDATRALPGAAKADLRQTITLLSKYRELVEAQRRGTRPQDLARAEGVMISDKYTKEYIRNLAPGTALPDQDAYALVITAVKGAKQVQELTQQLTDQMIQSGTVDPTGFRQLLSQLLEHGLVTDPKRLGAMAESGRGLAIYNDPTTHLREYLDQFSKVFEQVRPDMSPHMLLHLLRQLKDEQQLAQVTSKLAKQGQRGFVSSQIIEAFINSLLSNSIPINFLENFIRMPLSLGVDALAVGISKIPGIGSGRQASLREVEAKALGMILGMRDGVALARQTWDNDWKAGFGKGPTGVSPAQVDSILLDHELRRPPAITAETWGLQGTPWALGVNWLGSAIRTPGRVMMTSDMWSKSVFYRGELHEEAYNLAWGVVASSGKTGREAARLFKQEYGRILRDPPDSIRERAAQAALYQTMQNELGRTAGRVQDLLDSHPVLRMILPFFKTPINGMKMTVDHSILAPLTGRFQAAMRAGGRERDLAIARMVAGSMFGATITAAALMGQVTTAGPKDPGKQAELRERGWQPNSIIIPGQVFSDGKARYYGIERMGALGQTIMLAANISRGLMYMNDEDAGNLVLVFSSALTDALTNPTYAKGMLTTMQVMNNSEMYGESYVSDYFANVMPALALAINRSMVDPVLRDTAPDVQGTGSIAATLRMVDRIMREIQARTPGWSDTLPARRYFLGGEEKEVEREWWDVVNPFPRVTERNEVAVKVVENFEDRRNQHVDPQTGRVRRHTLGMPPRVLGDITLTPGQYSDLLRLTNEVKINGRTMMQQLERDLKDIEKMPYGYYSKRVTPDGPIKKTVADYLKLGQERLRKEYPDLDRAIKDLERLKDQQSRNRGPGVP